MLRSRLQDARLPHLDLVGQFPGGLSPTGMRAADGGLAGVGQDLPIDATFVTDAGDLGAQGYAPFDPTVVDSAPVAGTDPTTGSIQFTGTDVTLPGGATPGVYSYGGLMYYYDGSSLTPPPAGATGADPGYDAMGIYHYADGSLMYPDGTLFDATAGTFTNAAGAQMAGPSVATPDGQIPWSSILTGLQSTAGKIMQVLSGQPQIPLGATAGQVFRGSDGRYYRVNSNGTATAVPMPASTGLFGGGSSGLLLLGAVAVGAVFLLKKRG